MFQVIKEKGMSTIESTQLRENGLWSPIESFVSLKSCNNVRFKFLKDMG